ncbi:hypothetical protein ACMZ7W_03880 [Gardnerella vaginalis]|uniref:hypothetical protein n=1 Tax=Gardnerella vaginalis TaxID=2702 RepID=UPI0039F0107A
MVVVGSPAATIFITNFNKLITIIRIEAAQPMFFKNRNSKTNSQATNSKEYPYEKYEIYLFSYELLSFVPFLSMIIYFNGFAIYHCRVIIPTMLLSLLAQFISLCKKFNLFKEFLDLHAVIFFTEFLLFLSLVIRRCDEELLLGVLKQLKVNNPHCAYVIFVSSLFLFVFSIIVLLQLLVENQLDSLKIDIDFNSNLKGNLSIKNKLIFYSQLKCVYKTICIIFAVTAVMSGFPKI